MNTKAIEKNWDELKGQIKAKWGKLTDGELEELKGDLGQLAGRVQKAYGTVKGHAEQEFEDFKKSVHSLITLEEHTDQTAKQPDNVVSASLRASWVVTSETTPAALKATKRP